MNKNFKATLYIFLCITPFIGLKADIAPISRLNYGLTSITNNHNIRMESEQVFVDLYNDSSVINCTFVMMNYGEDITLEIGFPEMNFNTITYSEALEGPKETTDAVPWETWRDEHLGILKSNVNGNPLGLDNLRFTQNGNERNPSAWYVWKQHFERGEHKTITVSYTMPFGWFYSGDKHVGANVCRVFRYLLSTGAGWYQSIGHVDVDIQIHDIDLRRIDFVSPASYDADMQQKSIHWTFLTMNPEPYDDILIIYYDPKERKEVDNNFKIPASRKSTYADGAWYRKNINSSNNNHSNH